MLPWMGSLGMPLLFGLALVVLGLAVVGMLRARSGGSNASVQRTPEGRPPPAEPERVIPNVSELQGDDLEITRVEASPQEAPGNDGISKVEVAYEDDAVDEEITSPVARILVFASGSSDRGLVRKTNEDSHLVMPSRSLFAVADGMGGYEGGEVASAVAIDVLQDAFERNVFDGQTESEAAVPKRGLEMARAIQMANQAVLALAATNTRLAQMGTTLVAARFSPNKQRVYIGHVGDSRCYRLRDGKLRQLTKDHTMAQLGMKGKGSENLFQAVGLKSSISIDIIVDRPQLDDIYLLCSDGLSKMATDEQVKGILELALDTDNSARGLIDLAKNRGGRDNVTVILVKVADGGLGALGRS